MTEGSFMPQLGADVEAHVEVRRSSLAGLIELADRIDRFVGTEAPRGGHTLGSAVSSIFNGGSAEEIQAGLHLLAGWTFQPKPGRETP